MIRTSETPIEATLKIWASSVRDVKGRMRPPFTQERVAASALWDGLRGAERRKSGWKRAEAASDPGPWRQQAVLGRGRGYADALRDVVRAYALETRADPDAVLVSNETGSLSRATPRAACIARTPSTGSAISRWRCGALARARLGVRTDHPFKPWIGKGGRGHRPSVRRAAGRTTEIRILTDALGRIGVLLLAPGRIWRPAADKGYDAAGLRIDLRAQGVTPVIPGKRRLKRKIRHDRLRYRERWRIAATFKRIKDFRRVATRIRRARPQLCRSRGSRRLMLNESRP